MQDVDLSHVRNSKKTRARASGPRPKQWRSRQRVPELGENSSMISRARAGAYVQEAAQNNVWAWQSVLEAKQCSVCGRWFSRRRDNVCSEACAEREEGAKNQHSD